MKIAKRIKDVQPSLTLALTAKANQLKAEGVNVVSFGAGEPDFGTPEVVVERAIAELKKGNTKYTAASGTPELKKAVCAKFKRDQQLDYEPNQIIINCGAKHSLYNVFMTLLNDGDEVIIPAPFWLSYPEQITMAGGKSVIVTATAAQDFKITPAQLEAAITPKTAAIIINSPSNPTGMLYTQAELEGLAKVLEKHPNIVVVSDEIYEKLVYGGAKHFSFAQIPGFKDRTLIVNGMSKAYSMTGWRLGYTAGPKAFVTALDNMQSHSTSNPTTFCMPAAITALEQCEPDIAKMVAEFDKRRKEIVKLLNAIKGINCPEPFGAFYVFPDVSARFADKGVTGSIPFCEKLLAEANVNCVPGQPFGADNCIRLSYACSMDNIHEGLKRIAEWLK